MHTIPLITSTLTESNNELEGRCYKLLGERPSPTGAAGDGEDMSAESKPLTELVDKEEDDDEDAVEMGTFISHNIFCVVCKEAKTTHVMQHTEIGTLHMMSILSLSFILLEHFLSFKITP